jgi:hypothetical protein
MKIEIEKYITNNYYLLLSIAKKYTKNDDWASELLHEVILQLYDKKELKLQLDDNSIKFYIIRMLMVNWCYDSSPFYKKHKKHNITTVELNDAIQIMNQESEMDSHRFMEIMEEEFGEVNWFNKVIFEKYMVLGSLKKVSIDTTITLPSIGRYVKETRTQVKHNTFKRYNNE